MGSKGLISVVNFVRVGSRSAPIGTPAKHRFSRQSNVIACITVGVTLGAGRLHLRALERSSNPLHTTPAVPVAFCVAASNWRLCVKKLGSFCFLLLAGFSH
jgi:hypothetical protein